MTIGELAAALTAATENHAVYGVNIDPSREAVIRVNGRVHPIAQVCAAFLDGRFVLVADAGDPVPVQDAP